MSAEVLPDELTKLIAEFDLTFLVSVGEDSLPHVVAVTPVPHADRLHIADLGRHTRYNIAAHPAVTLIYAPQRPTDYSLIVDGRGELDADRVAIAPTRAILHRAAAPDHIAAEGECANDCRPIAL